MAALQIYTPDENKIVHTTGVDFNARPSIFKPIHIVQYDTTMPIIAVELYNNGNEYAAPATASANIRFRKKGGTVVYNKALGCSTDRKILYFEVTRQMVADWGNFVPIVELKIGEEVSGSSAINVIVDKNPIQDGDIESSDEFTSLEDYVNQAKTYSDAASASKTAAKSSEDSARASASQAAASASSAANSATQASASKDSAATSASQAASSALTAKTAEENATNSSKYAEQKASEAEASALEASESANAAAVSQAAAAASEATVNASKVAAEKAATSAATSQTEAAKSEANAKKSADTAAASQSSAATSATSANASKEAAEASQAAAKTAETNAQDWSNWSKSYAIGEGGKRNNEDTDNAKYYYDQAKRISQGLAGSLLPMGTITFSDLERASKIPGYMYNISDAFISDSTFEDGGDHYYGPGNNVYYTVNNKWDVLAAVTVTGVKGNAESTYHQGNIEIGPEDVKLPSNFSSASSRTPISANDTIDTAFSKTSKYLSDLKNGAFTDNVVTGVKGNAESTYHQGNIEIGPEDVKLPSTFSSATARAGIAANDTLEVAFSKLAKYCADLKPVAYSGQYSDLSGNPSSLKNPNALKFTGESSVIYDGSSEQSVAVQSPTGDTQNNIVSYTSGDSLTPNEWTNVEVLASKEKHSTILSKLSTMIKNVRYLWKMLGNSDISKIGDGTVTSALETIMTDKLSKEDIINDLLSTVADKALSAAMGKALDNKISELERKSKWIDIKALCSFTMTIRESSYILYNPLLKLINGMIWITSTVENQKQIITIGGIEDEKFKSFVSTHIGPPMHNNGMIVVPRINKGKVYSSHSKNISTSGDIYYFILFTFI